MASLTLTLWCICLIFSFSETPVRCRSGGGNRGQRSTQILGQCDSCLPKWIHCSRKHQMRERPTGTKSTEDLSCSDCWSTPSYHRRWRALSNAFDKVSVFLIWCVSLCVLRSCGENSVYLRRRLHSSLWIITVSFTGNSLIC